MKKLAITQRVDEFPDYAERRDCLDHRWYSLAFELRCAPLPLPNVAAQNAASYLSRISPDAIILSGGNTLVSQNPDAADVSPERDEFEFALLAWAIANDVPVLGVCRGMQVINHFLGGSSCELSGHVATRHKLTFAGTLSNDAPRDVNSFHGWGIPPQRLAEQLEVLATTTDGSVEAFAHAQHTLSGIMWHPERELPFSNADMALLRRLLSL